MTFYEAAVDVLRSVGRPLHYKKITELAVRRKLLSHVGKTPELTMGSRLSQEIRKDDGTSVVVRTRPGVFGLRQWQEEEPTTPATVAETVRSERAETSDESDAEVEVEEGAEEEAEAAAEEDADNKEARAESADGRRRRRRRRRRRGERGDDETDADGESEGFGQVTMHGQTLNGLGAASVYVLREDGKPLTLGELVGAIEDQNLARFTTVDREAGLKAALSTVNRGFEADGLRPPFERPTNTTWALTEWGMNDEMMAVEEEAAKVAGKLASFTSKRVGEYVARLPKEGIEHLMGILLERSGYSNIVVERRLETGEIIYSARLNQGLSSVPVAVMVLGEGGPIEASHVTHLRGTLHHFGAVQGQIATSGKVGQEAIDESRAPNLAPVSLIDGRSLASALIQAGVGTKRYQMTLSYPDLAYFKALGA